MGGESERCNIGGFEDGPRNIGDLQKVEKDKEPDSPQSFQKGTHPNYIFTLAQ